MAFSIKNPEADRLARRLAEVTGESLTDAVTKSLKERLEGWGDDGAVLWPMSWTKSPNAAPRCRFSTRGPQRKFSITTNRAYPADGSRHFRPPGNPVR